MLIATFYGIIFTFSQYFKKLQRHITIILFFTYPAKTLNVISENFHCSINLSFYEYKLILVGLPVLVKD